MKYFLFHSGENVALSGKFTQKAIKIISEPQ